jgi:hypothetical protein
MSLNPLEIYFTHSKINGIFTGCSKTIMETYSELLLDISKINNIPKIKVYYDGEKYYSENNRRLYLFKLLANNGILKEIPVRIEILKGKKLEKYHKNTYSLTAKIVGS